MNLTDSEPYQFPDRIVPEPSPEQGNDGSSLVEIKTQVDSSDSVDPEVARVYFPWVPLEKNCHTIFIESIANKWLEKHAHRPLSSLSPALKPDDFSALLKTAYSDGLSLSDLREREELNTKECAQIVYSLIKTVLIEDPQLPLSYSVCSDSDPYLDDGSNFSPTPYWDVQEQPVANQLPASTVVLAVAQLANQLDLNQDGSPAFLSAAQQEITELNPAAQLRAHACAEIYQLLGTDVIRVSTIIRGRALSIHGPEKIQTLEELGKEFDITRERVRQLEQNAEKDLRTEAEILNFLTQFFLEKYGHLFKIAEIEPFWLDPLEPLGLSITELALLLSSETFEILNGWIMKKGISSSLLAIFKKEELQTYGMISQETLQQEIEKIAKDSYPVENAIQYIEDTGKYQRQNGYWMPQKQCVQHSAAQLLYFAQKPLSQEYIASKIPDRSANSIANTLIYNEWFTRVGKNTWALTEWDMEEWHNLPTYIRTQIAQNGGRAKISDIRKGAKRFGVATGSINSYIGSPDYIREDGYLLIGSGNATNDSTPEEYSGMICKKGVWNLLETVDTDHIRGSGTGIPRGIIAIYDLAYNKPHSIPARAGDVKASVTLRWGRTGLNISSIRWAVEALELKENDRFWISFGKTVEFSPAAPEDPGLQGTDALLNYFGLEEDPDLSTLQQINSALGLDSDDPLRKTVQRLYHRREDDIAKEIRALVN